MPALVAVTGLHVNTVRDHLDGLLRSGLVTRRSVPAAGRGRAGWLYEATQRRYDETHPEHAGVAAALAAVIVRTSDDPAQDARRAGVDWGRRLAREAGQPEEGGDEAARRKVAAIFDDLGFAPETSEDAAEVRLTRCPLLEAAHLQPDVVCSVHIGIVHGALQTFGADPDGTELVPFAEPGACLLRLRS